MYLGELIDGGTHDFTFTTKNSSDLPTTLSGTPVLSVYKNNSITQTTAGITLTVDFDGLTGLNHVRLVLTDAFYVVDTDYHIVITAGTVGAASVVGTTVARFSIDNRGVISADIVSISGDSTAADNLELMYDGTGYIADSAPASRSQVSNIGAASSGSFNFEPSEDNTGGTIDPGSTAFVGVQTGTFANTSTIDGVYHIIEDTTNVIDVVYGFDIGGGRTATEVTFVGFANNSSPTDDLAMSVWDHDGAAWEQIATVVSDSNEDNISMNRVLLGKHTGGGSEIGRVYIRFNGSSLNSDADLNTDQLIIGAVNTGQSVGYADGAIWVDSINGVAGTEPFTNGVGDNAVLTFADALTLSGVVNLQRFRIINGSSITLTTDSTSFTLVGDSWFLDLNGQDISSMSVRGANITGTGIDGGARPVFDRSIISTSTLPPIIMTDCGFAGTITAGAAGDYNMENCSSTIAGLLTPKFDFGALLGDVSLNLRGYSGGIELLNMGQVGTDNASVDGDLKVILNANCVGGILVVRGNVEIIDNSGGAVTIEKIASTSRSAGYANASLWHNASASNVLTSIFIDGTADNPVSSIAAMDTLAGLLNLKKYSFVAGDNITITQSQLGKEFLGANYVLDLNGQIPPTIIIGAEITGLANNTTTFFARESRLGTTVAPMTVLNGFVAELCGVVDVIISGTNDDIEFLDCHGNTQGSMLGGSLDLKSGATTNQVAFQRWGGPITFKNVGSGDDIFMHGNGIITLDSSCTGGTLRISGPFELIDNAGGVVTVIDTTQFNRDLGLNISKISGNANAAARLSLSANQIIPFTVDTTAFTPTSAIFEADDIVEDTADHFNGRIIIWSTGALAGQATSITDYQLFGGRGRFTVVGMTEAPANNDTGIII